MRFTSFIARRSKGKIGLTINDKRNHVLKIQEIFLATLAFYNHSSIFSFVDGPNPTIVV